MTNEKIDIAINEDDEGVMDISFGPDGDFTPEYGFSSTIKTSLYEERRADPSSQPIESKRRGCIVNESSDDNTYERGSLLWVISQARANSTTRNQAVDYAKQALSHLVEDGYLENIKVTGFLRAEGIELEVILIRKNKQIDKLYFKLWENTGF